VPILTYFLIPGQELNAKAKFKCYECLPLAQVLRRSALELLAQVLRRSALELLAQVLRRSALELLAQVLNRVVPPQNTGEIVLLWLRTLQRSHGYTLLQGDSLHILIGLL
jgi:hypothetical protein